ncbi:HAD family hydrolase [Plantibacter sp. Mn2098]|uniref:HAD family hydrolase n=1 Tax=Plantibacter sp. Mn2098 TaxID=3395266 RepID=UPI003BD911D4
MSTRSPSLVITDVGGTLLRTDELHLEAWRAALAHYGFEHTQHLAVVHQSFAAGNDSFTTARQLELPSSIAIKIAERKRKLAEVTAPVGIRHEVVQYIESFRVPVCAVSHSEEHWTRAMLIEAGIADKFSLVLGRTTETSTSKAELIQICLDRFVKDRNVLYIGDTDTDKNLALEFNLTYVSALAICTTDSQSAETTGPAKAYE